MPACLPSLVPLGRPAILGMILCGLASTLPAAFDPAAAEDAAIERQKILKASDQIELLVQQNEQLRLQVQEMRADIDKLRGENAELRKTLAAQEKARAAEKEALLKEVSNIVASGKSTPAPPTPPAAPGPTPSAGAEEGFEHIVQAGQSLWSIAKAFQDQGIKVSVEDIRNANHLKDNNLHTGQKLFIPRK
ncbi:MAG: LysM peptidoglycan-binding domain-containing protein [Candidatus Methylacidiphilales bacterium]|nr:LysM peptidoglycan-binding domain-containing protein [Candidatus Methylacidiphilales bacterium]